MRFSMLIIGQLNLSEIKERCEIYGTTRVFNGWMAVPSDDILKRLPSLKKFIHS